MTKSDAGQLGGIATLQIHGVERCQCFGRLTRTTFFEDIGTAGGNTTVARYGRAHMQSIGKRGGRPRRQAAGAAVDNNGEGALTSRPPREV